MLSFTIVFAIKPWIYCTAAKEIAYEKLESTHEKWPESRGELSSSNSLTKHNELSKNPEIALKDHSKASLLSNQLLCNDSSCNLSYKKLQEDLSDQHGDSALIRADRAMETKILRCKLSLLFLSVISCCFIIALWFALAIYIYIRYNK